MSNKTENKLEASRALNCPKAGDVWREFLSVYVYVCDVDDGVVRAMKVTGGGRTPYLFETIADFQDYIMYDTAPVQGISGWTWLNFVKNDTDHKEWIKDWVEETRLYD